MDAFILATTWHYMTFAKTARGDVWRIWFDNDGHPLMEKLTPFQEAEYREPLRNLSNPDRAES
jgi:hypothetical protein